MRYNVKRATYQNGAYTVIARGVDGNTYIDETVEVTARGRTYYYVISAENEVGESTNSEQVKVTLKKK